MDDEARATGGLDPMRARGPRRRSPWGRRYTRTHAGAAPWGDRQPQTYAALDLGTNNCRLLVARPTADGFRVVDAFSRIIRLGEGVSGSGRISAAAVERALDALAVCRDKMRNRGVTRARLIATEACRSADNGSAFVERVQDEVGLDLEIIDRETEARLAATGCTPLVDPEAEAVVLFDIGGGSSELVSLVGGADGAAAGPPRPVIHDWASLPVGVVTLAERHGGIHIGRELFEAMVEEVTGYIAAFAANNAHLRLSQAVHMLGTSGTVTTIAGVHLGLKRYDRRQVDGCWMTSGQVDAVLNRLLDMTYDERVANACIGAERADLVLAGCAILEAIRRAFPCERLRVADRGLREGMLVEMMRDDAVWQSTLHAAEPS
jgi:exopolyphosphatase/guanosine-5'-triphosphate,3'-diphosphate pyrophosphatase